MKKPNRSPPSTSGGIIHTYQKYDPKRFPSPTAPSPDLVSPVFDHLLMYGSVRRLTEEELARAIRLDPSQIAGFGPSIEALRAMLLERKRKILARFETDGALRDARRTFRERAARLSPPRKFRDHYHRAVRDEQLYELEGLWYAMDDERLPDSARLLHVMEALGDKYQVDELAARYDFTGREPMSVPQAIEIKEELEKIDELLKQLDEARKTARIGVIDLDALAEFAEPGDLEKLRELQEMVENYVREMARRQGLEHDASGLALTPKAYRLFQGRLLERIFSELQASRSGRHQGPVVGEGAVETQQTKGYEFGDSLAHMDIVQSMVNALIRDPGVQPVRLRMDDIVIHRTRNSPKCATSVVMDMSGSMRYAGQYINVKRMALALQGLIVSEYPGDHLGFIEMSTFAKPVRAGEIIELLPKPVTVFDPLVRLKVDMSRHDISEVMLPPHFTNIQHALEMSRRRLAAQDTPNRQIILITDGLPTAHFEGSWLYLLYPPDPSTEEATLREGRLCARDGITINIFLIPSWSQSEEDIRFAYRLAESTRGRVFFTAGSDLDRYVVWDYVNRKREIIG